MRFGIAQIAFGCISFLLPLVAPAASSDYSGWRKSDGTPQSVMLSYYDGPDTRGFAWQTSTSVSSGALWLLKGEWNSSTGNFGTNQVATAASTKQTDCYTHKAHVTGLAAGTWSYRLGTSSHYAYGKFVVRDGTQPFVAVNITDIQLKSADKLSNWKNVVKAADTVLGGGAVADTIISCGDFFDPNYPSSTYAKSDFVRWGVTADQARDEFADVAWTMVSGNHDTSYCSKCCAENYNSAASSGGGCHSYDYGCVHVATIPYVSSLSSGVESWLKTDLSAAQGAQWRVLVMHFGPYTTADHGQGADATYVQKISGLCATYKVDLVLQGHDHTYSKTLPYLWSGPGYTSSATDSAAVNLTPATTVIGGETYYDNPEGTVYVSAGCAGDRVGENASIASSGYASRNPKIVCDKINVTSTYAKQGDNGSLSVNAPMFAVLKADESTLTYDWYVAASATPVLFDTLRIAKPSAEPEEPPEEPVDPEEPEEPDEPTPSPKVEPIGDPVNVVELTLDCGESKEFGFDTTNARFWLLGSTNENVVSFSMDLPSAAEDRFPGYSIRSTEEAEAGVVTLTGLRPGTARVFLGRQVDESDQQGTKLFCVHTLYLVMVVGEEPPDDPEDPPDDPDDPSDDPPDDPPEEPTVEGHFCVTPYLQRPSTDAMTIIFFTDSACTATVECGGMTTNTVGVWAAALTNNVFHLNKNDKEEKNKWNNSLFRHRVRFEDLKPNRSYGYTVTLTGGATYSNTFRTAPDRNTPIRFVSYADCETTASHFANYTSNLKKMQSRNPDLITTAGDLTARGGIQSHWDEFWMQNAGGNSIGYTDVLGSIPMLTAIGNHDLFDNADHNVSDGWFHDRQGEVATEKFLAYFEHNSNGVPYRGRDGTDIPETRDMSQLFHREDYGPVTLIFLDSNNGDDSDYNRDSNWCKSTNASHQPGGMDRNKGARHPDFNPGSPQYDWLTNQLADAQQKSRFTFVFNHHCPYSKGNHNRPPNTKDDEDASAVPLRVLTETMVRYGVDGWYCGHDELLEHSITNGYEILKDGSKRKHTLSIYDLGSSGDSARTSGSQTNPLEYNFMGNYGGSGNYGFLETDVTTNKNGQWTCTITPVQGSTGNYVTGAQIVYVENQDRGEEVNDLVYAEYAKTKSIPGVSSTKPSDWLAWEKSPEGVQEGGDDPEDPPDEPEDPPEEPEGEKWHSSYTIQEGETTGVIWAEYDGKDRWWKLDGGDESIAAPEFVDANPNEPKMSGCHTNHVRFTFTGVTADTTTWKAYTFTDGGQEAAQTYPGYDSPNPSMDGKTHGSGSWSDGSGVTITITVTPKPRQIVSATAESARYTGSVQTPTVVVTAEGGVTVPAGSYTVGAWSPSEPKDVGTYTATVTGTSQSYFGETTVSFTIDPLPTTVEYTGTVEEREVEGDAVYIFKSSGTLTIPKDVVADILVVGGGGSGAAGGSSRFGKSGTGGAVSENTSVDMPAGLYTITVGAGGQPSAQKGNDSTLVGPADFATLTGKGAAAVSTTTSSSATAGTDGTNAGTCDFAPDTTVRYGAGGDKPTTKSYGNAGTVNTGKGGSGGYGSGRAGGAGGSGVVIVRVHTQVELTEPLAAEAIYNGTEQTPTFDGIAVELVGWDETPKDVGEYHCTARGTGRFTGEVGVTFTINPAPVTVTAPTLTKSELESDPDLTPTVTGTLGSDMVDYTMTREPGDGPGDYVITASGETTQGNYTVSFVNGMLTVTAVTPFEKLVFNANRGGAYELAGDMEFPETGVLTVPAGAEFVLDLKGRAITCHADGAIVNNGKLTIVDSAKAGALQAHVAYSAAERGTGRTLVRNAGELVLDGVFVDAGFVDGANSVFGGGNTAVAATAGSVTAKNGAHVGGQTAIEASGEAKVVVDGSHVAGWRGTAVALAGAALVVSNSTLEAEGYIVDAASCRGTATIVGSTLASSYTTSPFNLGSDATVSLEKSIYVDRMASWFPVTTALANGGAKLKVGAGCLLAVASESVVGFLDEGVTAGLVAPRVWRTKGADDEALPPLTDEEKSRIADVLSSSPDALLKASVTEVKDYMAYRAWVDKGVEAGTIDSQAAAKGAAGSFFSFATDQKGLVDPADITEEKVKVEEMKVDGGEVTLTVGIEDLPVGEKAQAEYLKKVFGVTGTAALEEEFAAEKVIYGNMQNNGDGTVSYTVEPKVEAGEARPDAFFFKAMIMR